VLGSLFIVVVVCEIVYCCCISKNEGNSLDYNENLVLLDSVVAGRGGSAVRFNYMTIDSYEKSSETL
jgi:hypothetical protein